MSKKLVAYFSVGGNTEKLAKNLAETIGADLHKIQPEKEYTKADLDWKDKNSRTTIEMTDKNSRPAVANKVENIGDYDTIFIAFPIWWYVAPRIVNTFLEQYDLSGKTIIPLATSGGSDAGGINDSLKPSCAGSVLKQGKRFEVSASKDELKAWAESLEI